MLVGFGSGNINPAGPVELAGYGYFLDRQSTGVEGDGLSASALTFEDDQGNRAALCSADLLSIDPDTVQKVSQEVARLRPEGASEVGLLINASHTHSGPATREVIGVGGYNPSYIDHVLVPGLARTIISAFDNGREGEIGIARTHVEGVSYNRTGNTSLDTRLTAVKAETEDLKIGGAHFACHPVVRGKGSTLLSSDYPGVVRSTLHEVAGTDREFWLTGCCGDTDPLVNRERKGAATTEDLQDMGITLGEQAGALLESVRLGAGKIRSGMYTVHVPIDTAFELKVASELEAFREARSLPKTADLSGLEHWLREVAPVVNGNDEVTLPIPVTFINIGSIMFAGFGAEIYNLTGQSIEYANPDLNMVTTMNTNAHEGYVPVRYDYDKGLYAARSSAFIFGRKPLAPSSEEMFRWGVGTKITQLLQN